jgi:hypothetical protein
LNEELPEVARSYRGTVSWRTGKDSVRVYKNLSAVGIRRAQAQNSRQQIASIN